MGGGRLTFLKSILEITKIYYIILSSVEKSFQKVTPPTTQPPFFKYDSKIKQFKKIDMVWSIKTDQSWLNYVKFISHKSNEPDKL